MAQPGWYAKHPRRQRKDSGGPGNWKIICRNTRRIGSEYEARLGSFLVYREWTESEQTYQERLAMPHHLAEQLNGEEIERTHTPRMARVIGRVDRSGTGEPLMVKDGKGRVKPGWWLHCITLDNTGRHAYQRYVNPSDVEVIMPVPTAMARFFFAPDWPDGDTVLALCKHGSLANEYIDNALERIGNLRVKDGDVFYWALNGVEEFRVAVAKARKQGIREKQANELQEEKEDKC